MFPYFKPVLQFQLESSRMRKVPDARLICGPDHGNDFGRMHHDPGDQDPRGTLAIFPGQFFQQPREPLRLFILGLEDRSQRAPRHRPDFVKPHVVQRSVGHGLVMRRRERDLIIGYSRPFIDEIGLDRREIRNPEIQYFALVPEPAYRLRNFGRVHERAGTVQKQDVEVIGLEVL